MRHSAGVFSQCRQESRFNPRICKRCDTDLGRITPVFTVSIHASVKDATRWLASKMWSIGFNPRICKRCDLMLGTVGGIYSRFNPRICKRCDRWYWFCLHSFSVSIHASVKDATETKNIKADTSKFQSTHL